jgi:opacity protein-like surface antigen
MRYLLSLSKTNVSLFSSIAIPVCLAIPHPALAQDVPESGFFLGAGGGVSSTNVGHQDVYAVGTSDVLSPTGILLSSGQADGPPVPVDMDTKSSLVPSFQAGYLSHFSNSRWLWGAKLSYTHPNAHATTRNALIPQFGSFTTVATGGTTSFTGNALILSAQTTVEHQVALMPFIGRSFDKSMVYAGVGPTLSRMRTDENGVIGFADVNGTRTDVSGAPQNFSDSNWTYGIGATVGASYFLSRSWMLDVNYTYSQTKNQTAVFTGTFDNPNGLNGTNVIGTLDGTSRWSANNQIFAFTINKMF